MVLFLYLPLLRPPKAVSSPPDRPQDCPGMWEIERGCLFNFFFNEAAYKSDPTHPAFGVIALPKGEGVLYE